MQVLRVEITVVHGETMLPILLRSVQLLFFRVSSTPTGRTQIFNDPASLSEELLMRRGLQQIRIHTLILPSSSYHFILSALKNTNTRILEPRASLQTGQISAAVNFTP